MAAAAAGKGVVNRKIFQVELYVLQDATRVGITIWWILSIIKVDIF